MSNETTEKPAKPTKEAPKAPSVERKGKAEITRKTNGLVIVNSSRGQVMSQPGKSEVTVSLDGINGQPTPGQQPPQNSQDTQQPAPGAQGGTDGEPVRRQVQDRGGAGSRLRTTEHASRRQGWQGGPATIDDATADDARDALARAG